MILQSTCAYSLNSLTLTSKGEEYEIVMCPNTFELHDSFAGRSKNTLLGVLVRLQHEDLAAMCDVEQMFHLFHDSPVRCDFLPSLRLKENNPSKLIAEFQKTVHLSGN